MTMKGTARLDLVALVVANMVGVGVFTTSGLALQAVGSRTLLLALWASGGVYALLGAWVYGRLAEHLPHNGGEHHLLGQLLHPAVGFAAGIVSLTAGFAGPIAAAAHGLDAYTLPGAGAVAIVGSGLLHALTIQGGLRVQTLTVLAKVALMAAVIAIAGVGFNPADLSGDAPADWSAAFGIVVWISFSYTGWNAAVYLAGEHPVRSVAVAGVLGTLGVTVLYLALNAAFLYAGPADAVLGRVDVAVASAERHGAFAISITRGLAMAALVTSVSSMAMAGGRVVQSMARAGDLGPLSGVLGDRAPVGVAVLSGGALVAYLAASLPDILATAGWMLAGSSALTVLGGLVAGVFVHPGRRAAAIAFIVGTIGILLGSALHQPQQAAISLAVFVAAAAVHWLWKR